MDRPDIEGIEELTQLRDLFDGPTIDALQVRILIAYIKELEGHIVLVDKALKGEGA